LASTQAHRHFRVKTPLGADAFVLESFTGTERLSTPFRYVLRVLSENADVNLQDLLYKPVVLSLMLGDEKERHLHGNLSRLRMLETNDDGMTAFELEIVPWLWFLSLYNDCRIFQNKTVPQIVQKVFQDRGYSHFRLNLNGTYPTREYCVQYRESDLAFVSRLLEHEGIYYYFEHSEDKHTLVLADKKESFPVSEHQPDLHFAFSTGGAEDEVVSRIDMEINLHPGKTTLTDYDFEKPSTDLAATVAGTLQGEHYDYPGNYKTKDDGDRLTRIRMEEAEVRLVTVRADSKCRGLECGRKFTLHDHYREQLNQLYILIGVHQAGRNTSYRSNAGPEGFDYSNSFEAIPATVPFRPPRVTPRPIMEGTQTAVVVGPSGEEIYTDKHGRVKLQFPWDREGKADENSSCWVRVAQASAGKGFGGMSLPRIGHEVIVDFLEGDPDRPIITGRVYNAEQIPPYTLPDLQNVTTFKSLSTKNGGGFNEIRLDDTKDTEQIFINAQYNLDSRVGHDQYENIGNDQHLTIGNDSFEKIGHDFHLQISNDEMVQIGRDHHLDIVGKQAIKIGGTHSLKVTGDVAEKFGGNHSEDVGTNFYLKAGTGIVLEAGTSITLKCGSSSIVLDSTGVTISGTMVTIVGSVATKINSGPGSPPIPGMACNLVEPTAPKDSKPAATSEPGQISQADYHARGVASGKADDISPAPHVPPTPSQQAAAVAAGDDEAKKKTYIEIKLVDVEGNPVPGEKYKITLGDQTVAEGTLGADGKARVDGIDPGQCKVTFPNLDKTVWSPK
jgi:type VI secretion system secreted protein VgrG